MRAVVLAAGRGSRLGTLTEFMPKPLLRLGPGSILSQNLTFLAKAGVSEVAINLHHRGDEIRKVVGNGDAHGLTVRYSEEPDLLGTAGGVRRAEQLLTASWPLLVVYGDNLVQFDLARILETHRRLKAAATIGLHIVNDIRGCGIVSYDPSGRLTAFVEKPPISETVAGWVNSGVYLLEEAAVDAIPTNRASDFGFDIFPALLKDGQTLASYQFGVGEFVYPIDTLERYERSAANLARPFSVAPSQA